MQAQFGFYRIGDNSSGAYSSTSGGVTFGGTIAQPTQHFAIGAFTGDNGLPAEGTLFNSEADYFSYAMDLRAKTDQISSEGLNFSLANVVGSWIVIGGDGDDRVNAGGQSNPVTGDGMLSGGLGNDSLTAGRGNDVISGGDGDDSLNGSLGDDTISAGIGADTIVGGAGHNTYDMSDLYTAVTFDTSVSGPQTVAGETKDVTGFANLIGTSEGDLFTGNGADNHFQGGGGNDTLDSGYGADTLEGQGGDDLVIAGLGNQTLSGGAGNDTLSYEKVYTQGVTVDLVFQDGVQSQLVGYGAQVLSGFENLTGTDQGDTLTGDSGVNTILGGGGADTINGRGGDDVLAGGGGVNTVSYSTSLTGVTVDLNGQGAAQTTGVGEQTLSGFTNLEGSKHDDKLTGDASDNTITSGGGDDTMDGGGGHNTVSFFSNNDRVDIYLSGNYYYDAHGGTGYLANFQDVIGSNLSDTIEDAAGDADNALSGVGGNDLFYVHGGSDTLDGGVGADKVSYVFAQRGVIVDLNAQGSSQETGWGAQTLISIENVTGTYYADHLIGDGGDNALSGSDGDDLLESGDGADNLDGGDGADTVLGGAGDQTLAGGDGVDLLSYENASTYVTVSLALQGQSQNTNIGTQVLSGFENLKGSSADDSLYGDDNANQIDGNGGSNYINAAGGADTVFATIGDDIIDGGDGVDTLTFERSQVGVYFDLSYTGGQATGGGTYRVSNVENLIGTSSLDILIGDAGANLIDGGADDDTLSGGDGADTLLASGSGDHLDGGDGIDTASYAGASAGVNVDLSDATVVTGIELVQGSTYGDTLVSGAGQTIDGGNGDDVVDLSLGDSADGGAGFDTLSFASSSAGVTVDLGAQTAQQGGRGVQTFQGFEAVVGSAGADSLVGTSGADNLNGGGGDDTIVAGGGQDTLVGGAGQNTVSFDGVAGGVSLDLSKLYGFTTSDFFYLNGFTDVIGTADNDRIIGNADANSLVGGTGDDTLGGGVGDTLVGGDGNDTAVLSGRDAAHIDLSVTGNQTIGGGTIQISGVENLVGSYRGDYLAGNADANSLSGGTGADTLVATAGADTLDGGAGRDTADFSQLATGVHIYADGTVGAGRQTYVVQSVEAFTGTSFADSYDDSAGDQSFAGGDGDDTVGAGSGADTFNGGAGIDTISFSGATQGVTVSLADRHAQVTADGSVTLRGIENLNGSVYADHLTGDAGANIIAGNGGVDTIDGGGGDDTLRGSGAGDTVSYASATRGVRIYLYNQGGVQQTRVGDQFLSGFSNIVGSAHRDILGGDSGVNMISAGAGRDGILATPGDDTYDGGAGLDLLVYQGAPGPMTVDFVHGVVQVDGFTQTIISIEGLIGTNAANLYVDDDNFRAILAGSGRDTFVAGLGNDRYDASGNIDRLDMSAGNGVTVDLSSSKAQHTGMGDKIILGFEQVIGSAGSDVLLGTSGANVIDGGTGGDDVINGRGGNDTLQGGAGGHSTLSYAGSANGVHVSLDLQGDAQDTGVGQQVLNDFTSVVGSSYDDTLGGAGRAEMLDGARGNDHLSGLGGSDTLVGGLGKDVLDGGTAADKLVSLGDGDLLTGGTDVDTFAFRDLQTKSAATITDLAMNETIDLRGAEEQSGEPLTLVDQFHKVAGEFLLAYDQASNDTTVRFDMDGDGKADHLITLQGGDFTGFTGFVL